MRSRAPSLRRSVVAAAVVALTAAWCAAAQLSQSYYASTCPNVDTLVRGAVTQKLQETFNAAPGTLRLFFHDCFVRGCDASVLLSGPDDEHSAGADTTLSPDALDLITRAKAAVDADPRCANKVSCADILALAARDVVSQTGGPYYPVELGRLDGKVGTRAVVKHRLPGAGFDLDQLNKLFAANGLTQTDMIALSVIAPVVVSARSLPATFVARRRRACPFQPGGSWACPASSFSWHGPVLGLVHPFHGSMSIAGWLASLHVPGVSLSLCSPVTIDESHQNHS
ncbi:peroxidase 16-like isoform X2 [Panicum virgatum]|uniref:peroxidase 16-like isoform X2 n=1 Tax=Panicum virgatum TaxID=38727 RepID=UPI0019D5B481|nr:peroxidase 16-like isoform X2 [Panicum virgatum]